ncbi:MAG: NAD(P)H-hydrate dehydratase [Burkholderiales bacterium]
MSIPVFLTRQILEIEAYAFSQSPPPPLMERAGQAVADLAQQVIAERGKRVLVVAGPGNNGGDALVAARHLKNRWFDVRVLFTGNVDKLKADAAAAHLAWRECGGGFLDALPAGTDWDLALDGLFGIGLERDLSGRHADIAGALNAAGKSVVSIDIPSGLHADTGRVLGIAVRAAHTFTFLGRKSGLYTLDGPDHAGQVHCDDLGVKPASLPAGHGWLIADDAIRDVLPPRRNNSHKGLFGDVGIVGGAHGMVGAALLAGRAALKLGAGRVLVGLLADSPTVDPLQPDLMLRPAQSVLSREALACVVAGPGLGQSEAAGHALAAAVKLNCALVLDADALNLLAQDPALQKQLARRTAPTLLTPHPAEAARLLGAETGQVQSDRIAAALEIARRFEAAVVLKGVGSICAFADGDWRINTSGNPGMASAGMGDVLAGLIGALMAQGADPRIALPAAVRLHGLAADRLVAGGIGPVGLTASETIDAARAVLNTLAVR